MLCGFDDGQITRIGERVDAVIAEAVAFGESSDEPGPEALYENVYGNTATEPHG